MSEDTGFGFKYSEEMTIVGSLTVQMTADFNYSFPNDLVPHDCVQFEY